RRSNRRIILAWALAGIVLAVWAGAEYYKRSARPSLPALQPLVRLDLDLGRDVSPVSDRAPAAILSPDGTRLVDAFQSKLFTRKLDQENPTELPGTENARSPFYSPDGQSVAFFVGEHLKRLSLRGSPVMLVGPCPLGNGGSWGEDGSIVAGCNFTLSKFSTAG